MNENPITPKQEDMHKRQNAKEAIFCVLAVVSIPVLFLPLVFLSLAFAYPIIIDRPKLLFVPSVMLGIVFVSLFFIGAFLIPVFLVGIAAICGCGIGAGHIIRNHRESRKRAKIAGVIVMLIPFLFVMEMATGLMRSPFVHLRIRAYVSRNFPDFDFTVGWPSYSFHALAGSTYRMRVSDRNNPDNHFTITLQEGNMRRGSLSGTFRGERYWGEAFSAMLTPLLREEFGNEFHSFSSSVSGVWDMQPFSITADVEKTARITIATECATPETLTTHIMRYHDFILQSGFSFTKYTFGFRYENAPSLHGRRCAIDISVPTGLIKDDLPALIRHGRENRNMSNIFYNQEIGFQYNSHVGIIPDAYD